MLVILAHGDNAEWVDKIITVWVEAYVPRGKRWDDDVWSGRTELRGVVELRWPLIPTFVSFADLLDPSTVRVVPRWEFEQVFGLGFRFRRATLEMVPASVPVTGGAIEKRLPWLVGMTTSLAGTRIAFTNDFRERLDSRHFIRRDP